MRGETDMLLRCERLVAGMCIPHPFTLEALRRNLTESRGRSLTFHPLPHPTAPEFPSGMWLGTTRADYVFYDGRTSLLHRQHIIFHEIGHMLLEHNAESLADNVLLYGISDLLDPALIRRLLGRIRYSTREEQEAELTATLMDEAVEAAPRETPSGYLPKLAQTLGYPSYR